MLASSSSARALRIQSAALPDCAVGFATSTAGRSCNQRATPGVILVQRYLAPPAWGRLRAVPAAETEEHELLRQTVRQFTATRVESQAMEHDQAAAFNTKLLAELGKLGLIGVTI